IEGAASDILAVIPGMRASEKDRLPGAIDEVAGILGRHLQRPTRGLGICGRCDVEPGNPLRCVATRRDEHHDSHCSDRPRLSHTKLSGRAPRDGWAIAVSPVPVPEPGASILSSQISRQYG